MTSFSQRRIFNFSQEQLYSVVADIESYPRFIRGCQRIRILDKKGDECTAEVTAGLGPFQDTYICKILFTPYVNISVNYLSGPFEYLKNEWRFEPRSQGKTEINFCIHFCFKSLIHRALMNGIFPGLVHDTIISFEKEAQSRFGL